MWKVIFPFWYFVLSPLQASGFLTFSEEGKSTTINCTGDGIVQFWLLNGAGNAIDGRANNLQEVFMNGDGALEFKNVSKIKHEGKHVCVTKMEETITAYTVSMNVRPMSPESTWEARYRRMFITGVISSFLFLSLFFGYCLVRRYRYSEPSNKRGNRNLVQESYDNPAMVDDSEQNCSVKM